MTDKVDIIDFGGQYTNLISKKLRSIGYYNLIYPYQHYKGPDKHTITIILSGSPLSTLDYCDLEKINHYNQPILGICYGAQLLAKCAGCTIQSNQKEFGLSIVNGNKVLMSHSDTIIENNNIEVISKTENGILAEFKIKGKEHYGLQYHPETEDTENGVNILSKYMKKFGIKPNWNSSNKIKIDVKGKNVLMALSGGVDSSVAAKIIEVSGGSVNKVLVNMGFMRENEIDEVKKLHPDLNVIECKKEALLRLKHITIPERKRKIIGSLFIEKFSEYAKQLNLKEYLLGQGTIYSDVIESIGGIKSHHNVGGLPEKLHMKIVEPLRYLYKDEVRVIGKEYGISDAILNRDPFPGPGLAIRIIGEVTEERLLRLKKADKIYRDCLHNMKYEIWQAGAILLPGGGLSIGVQGDVRTDGDVIVLRAVKSVDGMTADSIDFEIKDLKQICSKIINNVNGVNRVVYDLTSKPPGTIEWG